MKRILVVDDSLINLKHVANLLKEDLKVSIAKSGQQAIDICQRQQPDLILLDIKMPDMDGFETLERLKKMETLEQTPILFLTATFDSEVEARAFSVGAADFVLKPFEKSSLLHRINMHLQLAEYRRRYGKLTEPDEVVLC